MPDSEPSTKQKETFLKETKLSEHHKLSNAS